MRPVTVHAPLLLDGHLNHLSATNTNVNRETQLMYITQYSILEINYGMANSVRVLVVPRLHHGSVFNSLTVQQTVLKYIFVHGDEDTSNENTPIELLEIYVQ